MWSKQADMRNANMTSFKNKITNRKQKASKSVNGQSVDNVCPDTESASTGKKQQKSGKHRGKSNKKVSAEKASKDEDALKEDTSKVETNDIIQTDDLELADVVLRTSVPSEVVEQNFKNSNPKRFSDSFVIENGASNTIIPRAVSGIIVPDELYVNDKTSKKSRRLSDLFRPNAMKSTCSVENLSIKQIEQNLAKIEKETTKTGDKGNVDPKTKRHKKGSSYPNITTKAPSSKEAKNAKNIEQAQNIDSSTNSYLKRVKSKIYKSKSDLNGILPSKTNVSRKSTNCERIPEDVVIDLKKPSNADFRLIRQSSNLEQIRSKTFGIIKSNSNTGIADLDEGIAKKPLLAKAKSSSAINLSLLRMRRSRILEQVKEGRCKDVFDEFDFIAFGGFRDKFGGSQKISLKEEPPTWNDEPDKAESKPSQPVSRSGSDRRPDSVREENLKSSDGGTNLEHGASKQENDTSIPDNTASFPSANNKKRPSSNINRSESVREQTEKRKQRRNISDPSHNTTSGDVELDQPGLSNTDSGSSSNSSISYNGRLSESPSNSVDVVTTYGGSDKKHSSDFESDAEMDPASWQKLFPEEELRNLQPHEKKRQDVINELFHTENSHVRNLKVLSDIFYKTIIESQVLKPDEVALIFPNIKEMLHVHTQFNKEMKRRRREDPFVGNLGDMLVNMFGGCIGESLQKAAAIFCERQQLALEFIKERRKRDSKFDSVLIECEKKRQCRRLPLQGFIPTEMQRLSKYPLLLERLITSVEANSSDSHVQDELAKLRRAHHHSKEILNYVNEAAKVAFNKARLEDIQRHLETSNFERSDHPLAQEFRTLDLTKYKLVREGNMQLQLRRGNKAVVPVHVLLLEEAVIILHKEGDKFLLKFFQSGSSAQPQPLSPIIKMSTLLVRNNAACKKALFLVNTATNGTQMYDLLAEDDMNRDIWFKHFSDATDAHNRREGKTKRPEPPPDSDESETLQEIPSTKDVSERAEAVGGNENPPEDEEEENEQFSDAQEEGALEPKEPIDSSEGGGIQTKITVDEWPLIQPSQVHVEVPPVHTAESRLTPLEQIRRKDEEVRKALEDKEGLVADLLSIPREHFHLIADMASDTHETRPSTDLAERVLAAVYQVDQLHLAVNEALNVTEVAAIAATGGKHLACQSQESLPALSPPSIPASRVRDVANSLSSQLTTLLSDLKQVEEERDRLRKELYRMRERLHEEQMLHGPSEESISSSPTPETQPDLDSIKESPADPES